ncbi:LptF/LptG family permease [Nitrospinaceae bacterium]|nr:LptF/LptG family permease [Nitrospinaceae bacterium]
MSINIIDRYILRELIKIFLITVGSLTTVLYLDKFLFIAENIVNRGVSILEVFLIMIYISPSYLALTVPISVLVASVATFNQFSASNEWVAMKSCHLSFMQTMRPVLIFSIFTYIVAVIIMVYALPWGNFAYKQKTYEIIKNRADINIKPNILNYDFKNLVFLAKKNEKKFQFGDIFISDTTQSKSPKIITANQAIILPNIESLRVRLKLTGGTIHELEEKISQYQTINFDTYELTLSLPDTAQLEKEALIGHRELSINLLLKQIKDFEKKGLPTFAAKVELSKKFAIPFTCLLFGLLGATLGIHSSRGGKSGGFATSIMVILLYYMGLIFAQNMGKSGQVEPYSSIWVPNIIIFCVIVHTSYKMQKDLPFNFINRIVDNVSITHKLLSAFYLKLLPHTDDNRMKLLKYQASRQANEKNTKK